MDHPAEARHIVRLGLLGLPERVLETAELLTSELVTNAIVHGHTEPTLTIEIGEERLRVEVKDADLRMDLEPLEIDPTRAHGRGLAIVAALASSWGIEPRSNGKAVWFQLTL